MPLTDLRITGEIWMPSNKDLHRALFIPAPPKCASRTLVALLKNQLEASVVRHKTASGHGHLVLNVPHFKLHERWIQKIHLQPKQKRTLIYGHYPASEHNINQLKRRYIAAAVIIPVRPLGSLLCSLIHHTRCNKYGPLDPRSPGLIDGIPDLHLRSESELFHLLGIIYIPQIYLLIRSWVEASKENNIPLIFVPFESITSAQSALVEKINSLLPKDYQSFMHSHEKVDDVKVNMSTTRKIKLCDIDPSQRQSIHALATKLLGCDDKLGPILRYLLSDLDLRQPNCDAPLAWSFDEQLPNLTH